MAYAPLTRKQTNKLLIISCRLLNSRAASQSLKNSKVKMFVTIAPEECQFKMIKTNVTDYYRVNVL